MLLFCLILKLASTRAGSLPFRKGLTEVLLLGMGSGVMSPPWRNSAQSIMELGSPAWAPVGPGSLDWPWTQVCSVCLERCLVAFQGLPVTEQGMSKAWLGEAVALGVLRRNYLILNSSQNSLILASFVSNAEMPGCHEDFT